MKHEPMAASALSTVVVLVLLSLVFARLACGSEKRIDIYKFNPAYWQYGDRPILLIGGTDDDKIGLEATVEGIISEIET